MLARLCSKSFKLYFNSTWTVNFQMHKLHFKGAEEPEIKLPTFVGSWRKQGSSRKTSTSASLTTLKPLTVFSSVQSLKLCLTLCDPMNCSTPGFPVHHQGPELAQTHVYQVGDAIQPSHLLSSFLLLLPIFPSIRVFSKESVLHIRWPTIGVSASASVLPKNIQDWFPLWLTALISLKSKGFSRVFSNTTVQKHQFFGAQLSLWSNSFTHIWLLEIP